MISNAFGFCFWAVVCNQTWQMKLKWWWMGQGKCKRSSGANMTAFVCILWLANARMQFLSFLPQVCTFKLQFNGLHKWTKLWFCFLFVWLRFIRWDKNILCIISHLAHPDDCMTQNEVKMMLKVRSKQAKSEPGSVSRSANHKCFG